MCHQWDMIYVMVEQEAGRRPDRDDLNILECVIAGPEPDRNFEYMSEYVEAGLEPDKNFMAVIAEAGSRHGHGEGDEREASQRLTPAEAKTLWLEHEVASLRQRLHNQGNQNGMKRSVHWSQGKVPWEQVEKETTKPGDGWVWT